MPYIIFDPSGKPVSLKSKSDIQLLQQHSSVLNLACKAFKSASANIVDINSATRMIISCLHERLKADHPLDEIIYKQLEDVLSCAAYGDLYTELCHSYNSALFHELERYVIKHIALWMIADIDDHLMCDIPYSYRPIEENLKQIPQEEQTCEHKKLLIFANTTFNKFKEFDLGLADIDSIDIEGQYPTIDVTTLEGFLEFTFLIAPDICHSMAIQIHHEIPENDFSELLQQILSKRGK